MAVELLSAAAYASYKTFSVKSWQIENEEKKENKEKRNQRLWWAGASMIPWNTKAMLPHCPFTYDIITWREILFCITNGITASFTKIWATKTQNSQSGEMLPRIFNPVAFQLKSFSQPSSFVVLRSTFWWRRPTCTIVESTCMMNFLNAQSALCGDILGWQPFQPFTVFSLSALANNWQRRQRFYRRRTIMSLTFWCSLLLRKVCQTWDSDFDLVKKNWFLRC